MMMLGQFTQAEAEVEYRRERIVADYAPRRRGSTRRGYVIPRRRSRTVAHAAQQAAAC